MDRKAASNIAFSCSCGTLHGHLTSAGVRYGTHVVCYCHDCRAAQLYFGQPDPAPGPVDVFHTTPDAIRIHSDAANLAVMRLSPKGMLRWYARCCNAPVATTPATPTLPFAAFIVNCLQDTTPLGPVTTRGFVPGPNGKQTHEKLRYALFGLLHRTATSRLSGRWRSTPFFDIETGKPVTEPVVLTKAQRATLSRTAD